MTGKESLLEPQLAVTNLPVTWTEDQHFDH